MKAIDGRAFIAAFSLTLIFPLLPSLVGANEVDLKPGDTIGPHNWEKVKDMVGPNLLNRIKQGYTFKLKEPRTYNPPKEFVEATERYSGKVSIGYKGQLLNYFGGRPFPELHPSDPQAGLKLAWNFYWMWQGDDAKNGGGTAIGKVIRYALEKDGSERRADLVNYFLAPRSRVTLDPKPVISGFEHIDRMQMRIDEYPRDASGTTTLEIRYADPDRPDDLYLYIPSIRRIRRATTTQRCQTLAPSEFNLDDINFFNGKVTDFNYKYLGEKKLLTVYSQEHIPYHRRKGDYLPLDEGWQVVDAWVLEITPKDAGYCYPRKVLYIEKGTGGPLWAMVWDKKGEYWKEMFAFVTPAKLPDGREVWSVGTATVLNVQNGRSTVLEASRSYNKGYPPSLFSLATLQRIMRGGTIE